MNNKTEEEIVLDKYWPEFVYPKENITPEDERYVFDVDYDRLRHLIKEHPREAFELACATGRVDMNTGLFKESCPQDNMQDYIEWAILEIVELLSTLGISGTTYSYFVSLLESIIKRTPIAPLTGNDWEWVDVTDVVGAPQKLYQNRRFTGIFKTDDLPAWWIDGKMFSRDGDEWYTNGDSAVGIEFPCSARDLKTERIRIYEDDENAE